MTTVVAVEPGERDRQSDPGSGVAIRDVAEPRPVLSEDRTPSEVTVVAPALVASAAEADAAIAAEPVKNAPSTATPSLTDEMAQQIFAVVSAALEQTLLPLLEKQDELEIRLARLQQLPPPPAAPALASVAPMTPPPAPAPIALGSVRPPMASTTYGLVVTPARPPAKSQLEIDLERVGPIDVPDFGRSRRTAGTLLVGLLLALVVAAIAATILSHT